MYFSFGYFWSLTFPGEDQGEWRTNNTYKHVGYTNYKPSICLDKGTTTEGDLNSIHLKFCKLQVWGKYVSAPKYVLSQSISCLWIGASPRILLYKKRKKMRGVAMVTTLSLHQQDTVVSALNVLLLTLNKALPGGRPRIARVSLMVRVKFSLNKF